MNESKEEKTRRLCNNINDIMTKEHAYLQDYITVFLNTISLVIIILEIPEERIPEIEDKILRKFREAVKHYRNETT